MRQQYQELEDNILHQYEVDRKLLEQEVEELKREKATISDFYSKKMQALQDHLSNKTHEADKRIAEADLRF
jgi:hypothetical protein